MRKAVDYGERYSPNYVLIEDAASGQSLIQMLKSETRSPILPVRPLGDKVARAHAVAPLAESGRVFLPEQAYWLRDFIDEATSFPTAPHDDQIDAMTQALNYLRANGYQPIEFIPIIRNTLFPTRLSGHMARRDNSSWLVGSCKQQDDIDDAAGARSSSRFTANVTRSGPLARKAW